MASSPAVKPILTVPCNGLTSKRHFRVFSIEAAGRRIVLEDTCGAPSTCSLKTWQDVERFRHVVMYVERPLQPVQHQPKAPKPGVGLTDPTLFKYSTSDIHSLPLGFHEHRLLAVSRGVSPALFRCYTCNVDYMSRRCLILQLFFVLTKEEGFASAV